VRRSHCGPKHLWSPQWLDRAQVISQPCQKPQTRWAAASPRGHRGATVPVCSSLSCRTKFCCHSSPGIRGNVQNAPSNPGEEPSCPKNQHCAATRVLPVGTGHPTCSQAVNSFPHWKIRWPVSSLWETASTVETARCGHAAAGWHCHDHLAGPGPWRVPPPQGPATDLHGLGLGWCSGQE
jgi:hypothetical protein